MNKLTSRPGGVSSPSLRVVYGDDELDQCGDDELDQAADHLIKFVKDDDRWGLAEAEAFLAENTLANRISARLSA
jgi:hypothetical protein